VIFREKLLSGEVLAFRPYMEGQGLINQPIHKNAKQLFKATSSLSHSEKNVPVLCSCTK